MTGPSTYVSAQWSLLNCSMANGSTRLLVQFWLIPRRMKIYWAQLSANVIYISVSKTSVKLTESDCISYVFNGRIFPGDEMLKKSQNNYFLFSVYGD